MAGLSLAELADRPHLERSGRQVDDGGAHGEDWRGRGDDLARRRGVQRGAGDGREDTGEEGTESALIGHARVVRHRGPLSDGWATRPWPVGRPRRGPSARGTLDSDWGSSRAPRSRTPSSRSAAWHLGLTDGANDETKARYAFVCGDFRRVHRTALIARRRASEWRHKEVELAAHGLLQLLDRTRMSAVTSTAAGRAFRR